MNQPDEKCIRRWLDGELEGKELRAMESWAESHASELESQMGWKALGNEIKQVTPDSVEPPYPDFFNQKIKQSIISQQNEQTVAVKSAGLITKLRWLFAPLAVACMTLCFYAGTMVHQQPTPASTVSLPPEETQEVYTPMGGVSAHVSESEIATVIVLDGLDQIPDSLDIVSGETGPGRSPMMMVRTDDVKYY